MKVFVDSPADATIKALEMLDKEGHWVGQKKEIINYSVQIDLPFRVGEVDDDIRTMLDEFHGKDHFKITSAWTFPKKVKTNLAGEPTPGHGSGEYFEKLCSCEKGNQLVSMVDKINQWGRNNRTVAQVFNVDRDLNAMFPPCLMHIQVFYRQANIHLTAYFRSHTVAKSYYGDLIGLARMQKWIAEQTSSGIGSLTVHSGSLHIRKKNDEDVLAHDMMEELC